MQQTDSSRRRRGATMRRRFGIFAVIGGMLMALFASVGVLSASAKPPDSTTTTTTAPAKVTLCHATASQTNPYEVITTDQSAVFASGVIVVNGHGTHTGPIFDPAAPVAGWGDIIPAFDGYTGLNNTAAGLAILANGCKILPSETTTTTAAAPTVIVPGAAPATAVTAPATFTG
jgi:hypothetical protein